MIKELNEIRDAMLKGVEEKDLLYIKMQINKIDILLYNISKNNIVFPVITHLYYFDCWDKTGDLQIKEIKATCEEHAILLFEKEFGETHKYDPPYN